MPSIALKQLGFATPDGKQLFTDLDLTFPEGRTGLVGRNGVGKSTLLHLATGDLRPLSGTIDAPSSMRLMRQTETRSTVAELFEITEALERLDRIERGQALDDDLDAADWTLPARLSAALAAFGLPELAPDHPLGQLSGGQATRAALAALTFDTPDFILLDEPTNNLDAEGRALVIDMLAGWRGGALVVSHDRDLLRQMDQIIELTTLGASTYGGNWDAYREQKALELDAAAHDREVARRELRHVERKATMVRERKARRDSAGKASRAKGDQPKLLLNARRNRAEGTSGTLAQTAERRRTEATEHLADADARIERLEPVTVELASTGLPANRTVLSAIGLTGGPTEDSQLISGFDLMLRGPERVALTGPNGSGKTTLLRLIIGDRSPSGGEVRISVPYAMLDQRVALLEDGLTIRENFLKLNPEAGETTCRAALARFRFRADAALQQTGTLSGGQRLRAGLACTIGAETPPHLLILDEPTNHLDLEAIEAVEAGLAAYDGAILVVSHDAEFLDAIGIERKVVLPAPA